MGNDDLNNTIQQVVDKILQAQKVAFDNLIEANTVIINDKYAKVNEMYVLTGRGHDYIRVPAMLCGLSVEFKELPEQVAFILRQTPQKTVNDFSAAVRVQVYKEVYEWLCWHAYSSEERGLVKAFYEAFIEEADND